MAEKKQGMHLYNINFLYITKDFEFEEGIPYFMCRYPIQHTIAGNFENYDEHPAATFPTLFP